MQKSINTLRMLGVQMVNKANSGHPGIVLGAAPIVYALFNKHINISNKNKTWINRDRFVLSAGHGSALLYSLLHLSQMGFKMEDLMNFRQAGSSTPGHPEYDVENGVECTTGPLGQGIGMGVGMAIAEASLRNRFNREEFNVIDHYTYVLCGDGDLQEGVSEETLSIAGRLKLNKLIILFDSNDVQLDSQVELTQSDNLKKRCDSHNWNYQKVADGNNVKSINKAIEDAKLSSKPTLIEIKTTIGEGATKEGTSAVHGAPLGDDIENVKIYYQWDEPDFTVPKEVVEDFQTNTTDRGNASYSKWKQLMKAYKTEWPELYKELNNNIKGNFSVSNDPATVDMTQNLEATRASSGKILNLLSKNFKNIIGGSADLTSSTKAKGADGDFLPEKDYHGRNIAFGVREFGMGTINNGLALHGGLKAFASTFFVFTDYLKPALRLASLMGIGNLWILSHDSVLLGEDGPTHQPVEQLTMLRAQPNLNVFRPADYKEAWGVYTQALTTKFTPSVIVTSRQGVPQLKNTSAVDVGKGAYNVYGADTNNDIIITATGSEVHLAINVAKTLKSDHNLKCKVISMPCMELFNQQPKKYQTNLYEGRKPFTVTLEFGATIGWAKFGCLNIGIDHFGMSGKADDILTSFQLKKDDLVKKILQATKRG